MECAPDAKAIVVVTVPVLPSVTTLIGVAPSFIVTVPPGDVPDTCAVKSTLLPEGADAVRLVVVLVAVPDPTMVTGTEGLVAGVN